jgi:hypothetical protein
MSFEQISYLAQIVASVGGNCHQPHLRAGNRSLKAIDARE